MDAILCQSMALQDESTTPPLVVLTTKQDAFMLAVLADVEEKGMLHGNLLRKRVKIEPDYRPQHRGGETPKKQLLQLLRENASAYRPLPTLLRLDADFCLELARELLRSEL